MKKIFYITILFLLQTLVIGQAFKQYKQTQFHYLSSDKKLHGRNASNQPISRYTANGYIKRGDTILILSMLNFDRFLVLFEKTPTIFDSLFTKLHRIEYKNSNTDKFDKILKQTKYKVHSDIGSVPVFYFEKDGAVTWDITNTYYLSGINSCYLNIIFNVKSKTESTMDVNNLELRKIVTDHCDN